MTSQKIENETLLEKTLENLCICQICEKRFKSKRSTLGHIKTHNIKVQDYYNKFFNQILPKIQICSICGKEKPISEYYFRIEKQEYRVDCKECHLKQKKIYMTNPKIKEHRHEYAIVYYPNNRERFRIYQHDRRKNNMNCYLRTRYSNKVNKLMKINNIEKLKSNSELLCCTINEFKEHIKKQFKEGMTENNKGFGKGKWHLDHVIPCSFFNLLDPIEFRQCFHWTNYQPMWHKENLEKTDRIDHPSQLCKNLVLCVSN